MADFVGSAACPWWPLGMPRCPPSPGSKGRADRPARQQEGPAMTEASVSFAGNLTDDPEVRYTDGGSARSVVEVVAEELGPSLRWATATTTRATRTREPDGYLVQAACLAGGG